MRKIDDHEYTVEISCYFLTKWKDDRLILSDEILSKRRKHLNVNTTSDTFASEMPHGGELRIPFTWCYQHLFMRNKSYTFCNKSKMKRFDRNGFTILLCNIRFFHKKVIQCSKIALAHSMGYYGIRPKFISTNSMNHI